MHEKISIILRSDIIYVEGMVNGVIVEFTKIK